MFGKGLLTGMTVTIKHFFGKKETFCYPEEKLPMTERWRGGHLVLDEKKCIACQLCSMACPNKALTLTVVTDENKKKHMAKYLHHSGRCLYCNLCIERCPAKALDWDQEYAISSWLREDIDYDCVKNPPPPAAAPPKPAVDAAKPTPPKGGTA